MEDIKFTAEDGDKLLFEFNLYKKPIGRLIYNNNKEKIRFEGNLEESSKLFFDYLIRYLRVIDLKSITMETKDGDTDS